MKNSYTNIHYNEELRPYTKYPPKLCKLWADKYFKTRTGKMLDVCCGRGEHMALFKQLGFDVYGVDKDDFAKEKGLNVKECEVGKDKIPFKDKFFDVVVMKSAIEHIGNVYNAFEEISRVMKPGAKIIITTCDWKRDYKIFYDDADHKSPFTSWSLLDLLLRYDFKNVRVEYFYHLPFVWKAKFLRVIPWTIARLIPIDTSPTVKFNPFIKLLKFSRERELLAYAEK